MNKRLDRLQNQGSARTLRETKQARCHRTVCKFYSSFVELSGYHSLIPDCPWTDIQLLELKVILLKALNKIITQTDYSCWDYKFTHKERPRINGIMMRYMRQAGNPRQFIYVASPPVLCPCFLCHINKPMQGVRKGWKTVCNSNDFHKYAS